MLMDPEALGAELRDEGIDRAVGTVAQRHPEAFAAANRKLVRLAVGSGRFTSEDVIEHLEARSLITPDMGLHWLGDLFLKARRAGIVECVGYVPSRRPSRHRGPVAEYQKARAPG